MNSKEVLKEIRTLLGFSEDKKEVEMATATLVDGTIVEWEGELAVGTAIFVQTGEGLIPAPDAVHEVEGGLLVTTEGGVVTEIVEPTEEVEIEVDGNEFDSVENVQKFFEKENFEADLVSLGKVVKFIFNDMYGYRIKQDQIENELQTLAPLVASFEELKASNVKHKEAMSKAIDLIEKIADLPSDEPIKAPAKLSKKEEQFANIIKIAQQLKNK
jgi:hypothetical protein